MSTAFSKVFLFLKSVLPEVVSVILATLLIYHVAKRKSTTLFKFFLTACECFMRSMQRLLIYHDCFRKASEL